MGLEIPTIEGSEGQSPASRANSPTLARIREQIEWYDGKSGHCQRWFKRLKICQIVTAAAIPVMAGAKAPYWLVGGAGALIVVLEGLQQLQQYQQNWITYRATCERLKHEKFLYLARAGSYATVANADALLAERVEGLVSQEHAAWAAHREDANQKPAGGR
jgi:uncharacterized protein DUF4231